jgi:hypothetical protein
MAVQPIEGRLKPCDLKAEVAVLSSVLCSFDRAEQAKLMGELVQLLVPAHFFGPQHAHIWSAMLVMHSDHRPIDIITLKSVLSSAGHLERVGGVQYLAQIMDEVPATAYPLEYARIVLEHARVRRTISVLEMQAAQGYALGEGESADYLARVHSSIREVIGEEKRQDEWISGADIFAPLPPVPWVCRGLAIGPGRPHTLVGFGYSGKTVAAQGLALAVASGTDAWGRFACKQGIVRHLDHEVGRRGTLHRYQRLAFAHGITPDQIGDRLRVLALPRIRLSDPGAEDWYTETCTGTTLCIIDSLRAAIAGDIDENDSAVRSFLDILLRVSDTTGCSFVVLHHSGKGRQEGDQREAGRGSSAIYDASGTVLKLDPQKHDERSVTISKVQATKMAAEASGGALEPFWLRIEDVADDEGVNERAGLRCGFLQDWEPNAGTDDAAKPARKVVGHELMMKATFAVETYVRANPGCTGIMIRQGVSGFGGDTIQAARDWLRNAGRLELRTAPGGRGSNRQCWYATKEEA